MDYEKTERGFIVYGKFIDAYGSEVRVQESSWASDLACWVFCKNNPNQNYEKPTPHLTVEQAKQLIAILQRFVDRAPEREKERWPEMLE